MSSAIELFSREELLKRKEYYLKQIKIIDELLKKYDEKIIKIKVHIIKKKPSL